jgi:non-specific serine/threonine protein kinase
LRSEHILDALTNLTRTSLIVADATADGVVRFSLLETLRDYARQKLMSRCAAEIRALRDRHVDFLIVFAKEARPVRTGNRNPAWVNWQQRIRAEQDNLRTAMHWCVETGDVVHGLELGGLVWPVWQMQGSPSEGREWLEQLHALLNTGPSERTMIRAGALRGVGVLAMMLFDYTVAEKALAEELAIRNELGEPVASVLYSLGSVAWRQGEYAAARRLIAESVKSARTEGNRNAEANALYRLGQVVEEQGNLVEAYSLYSAGLAVYRQIEDKGGIADALAGQGRIAFAQGKLRSAEALFEENLALARELNDSVTIAWGCFFLALVCLQRADWTKAGELFAANLHARGYLQDQRRIPRSLAGLAHVAAATGNPERALRLFGAAMALRRATKRPQRAWSAPPFDPESIGCWEPAARLTLGEEAAAAAFAAGAALSLEEAVAYALEAFAPA